jgi:hypothetical protein
MIPVSRFEHTWRLGRVKGISIADAETLLLRNLKPQVQLDMS